MNDLVRFIEENKDLGARADLRHADQCWLLDRPVYLLRRPQPPALAQGGVGRGRGQPNQRLTGVQRPERDLGVQEDLEAAQRRRASPPGGSVHRRAAHAGPRDGRHRAGTFDAHHTARGLLSSARGPGPPRLHRRASQSAVGRGRTPTSAPGPGSATRPSAWTCTPAGSWGGRPPAGRGTDFVLSALEQAVWQRKDRDGRSLAGLAHHSDHGSKSPVHQVRRSSPE